MASDFPIVFALFPRITQLDFTGPFEVLSRLPGARCILASVAGGTIQADGGITFGNVVRLAAVRECSLLCVPGGFGTVAALEDPAFLTEIARLGAGAQYVTFWCAPAPLLLAAAGLLGGRRAACHWAWRDLLPGIWRGARSRASGARRQRHYRRGRHRRYRHGVDGNGRSRRNRLCPGGATGARIRSRAALRLRAAGARPARNRGDGQAAAGGGSCRARCRCGARGTSTRRTRKINFPSTPGRRPAGYCRVVPPDCRCLSSRTACRRRRPGPDHPCCRRWPSRHSLSRMNGWC